MKKIGQSVATLALLASPLSAQDAGELKIGWGRESIAPKEPVTMTGYGTFRLSCGVEDEVTATALVLDNGKEAAIFTALDTINGAYAYDEIIAAIKRLAPEVPADKIMVNAIHSHSSVGLSGVLDGVPKELGALDPADACKFVAEAAAKAIKQAWAGRRPGAVAWGYGLGVTAFNRRMVYFDDLSKRPKDDWTKGKPYAGFAEIHGLTRDDKFAGYENGADNFIQFLYTFDRDGKLTGAIVNMACTAQLTSGPSRKLTSDLWYDIRQAIRRKHPGCFILPQCAGAGDLMPYGGHFLEAEKRRLKLKYGQKFLDDYAARCNWPGITDASRVFLAYRKAMRMDIAERVAAVFDETLQWAANAKVTDPVLKNKLLRLRLTPLMIPDEELARMRQKLAELEQTEFKKDGTLLEQAESNYRIANGRHSLRNHIARAEGQRRGEKFYTEARVVRIGDVAFASNGFELFMDYMHRMQARSPFLQTFVVELSGVSGNCWGGYLPTRRALQNRGYSATVYQSPVGADGGQELVEETLKALKELAK